MKKLLKEFLSKFIIYKTKLVLLSILLSVLLPFLQVVPMPVLLYEEKIPVV